MRLWQRLPDRIGKKALGSKWRVDQLAWALSLRPGDVVNTCDLFNHVVQSLTVHWRRHGRRGRVVLDVEVQTDRICCSALHCGLTPALTERELRRQLKEYLPALPEEDDHRATRRQRQLISLMEQGTSMLDDRGLLRPEFEDLAFGR